MASRNRTTLFIQYRNSFGRPKKNTEALRDAEKIGLIGQSKPDFVLDMPQLPPKWVDIVEQFDAAISIIREKSRNISIILVSSLENIYKRHVLPGFSDKGHEEASIEQISMSITKVFLKWFIV